MGNYAPNNYPPVNGLGLSSGHAGFGGGGGGGGAGWGVGCPVTALLGGSWAVISGVIST